jgi:hypothetical protein
MLDHILLSVSDTGRTVCFGAAALMPPGDNGAPGASLHFDTDHHAVHVLDPTGYSLEFVYEKRQHIQ